MLPNTLKDRKYILLNVLIDCNKIKKKIRVSFLFIISTNYLGILKIYTLHFLIILQANASHTTKKYIGIYIFFVSVAVQNNLKRIT